MSAALDEHVGYLADGVRLERFRSALSRIVKPGDTVVDLGCGTGVLGLLCLQAGAAKVWGIDSTPMAHVAQETVLLAGLQDRYVCLNDTSFRVQLPEMVDIAICDHVGFFGFDYGIQALLQDARRRFLKAGGRIVPSRIQLKLGLVSSVRCSQRVEAWARAPIPAEYHWLREYGINSKHPVRLSPEEVVGEPVTLGELDLRVDNPEFQSFSAQLRVDVDGRIDGLGGWFECELGEGIWMTNSPLSDDAINREQVFFPINQSIHVRSGDVLTVNVMARPTDHLIAWSIEGPSAGQRVSHSTWKAMLLTREDFLRSQPNHVVHQSRLGIARRTIMDYCDGKRTIAEIENLVLKNHPNLFASSAEISRFVLATLARDAE